MPCYRLLRSPLEIFRTLEHRRVVFLRAFAAVAAASIRIIVAVAISPRLAPPFLRRWGSRGGIPVTVSRKTGSKPTRAGTAAGTKRRLSVGYLIGQAEIRKGEHGKGNKYSELRDDRRRGFGCITLASLSTGWRRDSRCLERGCVHIPGHVRNYFARHRAYTRQYYPYCYAKIKSWADDIFSDQDGR